MEGLSEAAPSTHPLGLCCAGKWAGWGRALRSEHTASSSEHTACAQTWVGSSMAGSGSGSLVCGRVARPLLEGLSEDLPPACPLSSTVYAQEEADRLEEGPQTCPSCPTACHSPAELGMQQGKVEPGAASSHSDGFGQGSFFAHTLPCAIQG